jgi:hypothetical protein
VDDGKNSKAPEENSEMPVDDRSFEKESGAGWSQSTGSLRARAGRNPMSEDGASRGEEVRWTERGNRRFQHWFQSSGGEWEFRRKPSKDPSSIRSVERKPIGQSSGADDNNRHNSKSHSKRRSNLVTAVVWLVGT